MLKQALLSMAVAAGFLAPAGAEITADPISPDAFAQIPKYPERLAERGRRHCRGPSWHRPGPTMSGPRWPPGIWTIPTSPPVVTPEQ